jgi:subtilisin family serine protease
MLHPILSLIAALGLLPFALGAALSGGAQSGQDAETTVQLITSAGQRYAEVDGQALRQSSGQAVTPDGLAQIAGQRGDGRVRVIVLLTDDVQPGTQLFVDLGSTVQVHRRFTHLLHGLALSVEAADLPALLSHPSVQSVHADTQFKASLAQSVPLIGAPQVWTLVDRGGRPVTGQGVRVAVLDTGVDYRHPALGGCLGDGCKVVGGYDFVHDDGDPLDDHGHGTHVAGIVAADGLLQGVAPEASLLAYKVLDGDGVGYASDIIAALEQAVADGAGVINLSLGAPSTPGDPVSLAAEAAVDGGCVVVAAAGNNGPRAGTVEAPATAPGVIAVAAADKDDVLADFSGRGPAPDSFALKPDLTAPGVSISSTVPFTGPLATPTGWPFRGAQGWHPGSGTSAATPHVSGGAALLRQLHPDWTPTKVKAALMNRALDLGTELFAQGAGRVDLAAAATPALLAVPGSLSFGLPLLDGTETLTLTVYNPSSTTLDVTPTLEVDHVADGAGQPISPTQAVTYATVSPANLTVPPDDSRVVTVTLDIPPGAESGHFQGRLGLETPGDTPPATVPLAFSILSRVTVRVVDGAGEEIAGWGHMAVLVRAPDADVVVSNAPLRLPATFTIPAGDYYVQAFGRFGIYDHFLIPDQEPQVPYVLIQPVTIESGVVQTVTLDLADTRPYWLDAVAADGDPAFINAWAAALRYQVGETAWLTRLGQSYVRVLSTDLDEDWPSGFRLRLSDTPPGVSFHLALQEVGFSPRYREFVLEHGDRWPAVPSGGVGFPLVGSADQGATLDWERPSLDASTPPTFTTTAADLASYAVRTDLPSLLGPSWIGWEPGGVSWFHPPTGIRSGLEPAAPGVTRTIKVAGAQHATYRVGDSGHHSAFYRPFYTADWSQAEPWEQDANVLIPKGAAMRAWLPDRELLTLGAGPLYPALVFDNRSDAAQMRHPLLAGATASPLAWGTRPPTYTLALDAKTVVTGMLPEHTWLPFPMRRWPDLSPGSYELTITPTASAPGIGPGITRAGFTLSEAADADLNPPQIVDFSLPQRFDPATVVTATWVLSDASPAVLTAAVRLGTRPRSPLVVQPLDGGQYTARIEPQGALTVSLSYTATDTAGNWLAWQAFDGASSLAQVPVTLTFALDPPAVPWSRQPVTVRLRGSLLGPDGQPLAEMPAWLRLCAGGSFVGYVRDLTGYRGNYQTGHIDFPWTFVPADLAAAPGPVPVSLEFDVGLYAAQIATRTLNLQAPVYLPLILQGGRR